MITENLKIFGILLLLQISSSFQEEKSIQSFDELRLKWLQPASEELIEKINNVFVNLTKSTEKTELITSLKFSSHDDSNNAYIWNGGSKNTYSIDKNSKVALKAYDELLKSDEPATLNYHRMQLPVPGPYCPNVNITCNPSYPYRSIRGSCNNLANPWWGMKETPYKRLLPADYADAVSEPRARSVTGSLLPNPRTIALELNTPKESKSEWSNLFVYFGQQVAHDLTLVASATYANGKPKECTCDSYDSECLNIPIPPEDELNQDQKCMTFLRSSAAIKDFDCNLGPREQINLVTHWLDLSSIYGSDTRTLEKLRLFRKGLLKTSKSENSNLEQLPHRKGTKCTEGSKTARCFMTGESRAEDNGMLLSVHALWLREHNRIARVLAKTNPNWSDETLFQETRRIVIAEYQHIIYAEFLPSLLGHSAAFDFGLQPLENGFLFDYDSNLYPQVLNEFSTNAFRIFHSLVTFEVKKANNNYEQVDMVDVASCQFNSSLVMNELDSLLYGLVSHWSYRPSIQINPALHSHQFEDVFSNSETIRWSLPALNINRGRDHGLPGYAHYRRLCGLSSTDSFDDLIEIPARLRQKLKRVYDHPDDIDLFIGLLSEKAWPHTVVGPTAACIIAKQFNDLKYSDRFYYENGHDKNLRFTRDQLNSIRRVTMARILCDNSEIEFVQEWAFLMPHKEWSRLVNCNQVPELDLSLWNDYNY